MVKIFSHGWTRMDTDLGSRVGAACWWGRYSVWLMVGMMAIGAANAIGADVKPADVKTPDVKPVAPLVKGGKGPTTAPNPEEEFYKLTNIQIPVGTILECGALEVMPDGKLAVATRRGDIFMVEGAMSDSTAKPRFTKWASGLHEVLGLAQRDGSLYAVQRPEVTRLKDSTGSGRADVYETFCDSWGINGDYHEFAISSKFDKAGNLLVALCLTGSKTSDSEFRGWCMRITPEGKAEPFCSGVRSPGGIGLDAEGQAFMTDNQGFWNGTDVLKPLVAGKFVGAPTGNKWYSKAPGMGPQPKEPASPSRLLTEAEKIPEMELPAVLLPYRKVGQSSSGVLCDMSGGKFGPFNHQLFVADQHHSNIARVSLEKIGGRYQGACYLFRKGLASGPVPMVQGPDGSFFVGGTNRGWGSAGPKPFALERLSWTGKTPFEILEMNVKPDGFDLSFTQPVDRASAGDVKSYDMSTYTYIYQATYGSPEVDATKPTITSATVSEDGLHVRLVVDGLVRGHVHELHLDGVRGVDQKQGLLHAAAYYTLWKLPEH